VVRRRLTLFITGLVALLAVSGVISAQSGEEGRPGVFRNPLNAYAGADPWLTYYEGSYYLATTTWTSEITMRESPTLAGLKTAAPVQIYFETDPSRCCNIWAPEFRLLDGPDGLHWYFYYTAGTAGTLDNQHSHVLESAGTDPMGPYTYKGRLFDPQHDTWSIDGSVLQLKGSLYFLFSAFDGPQSVFIAPMSNPWTISGPRVLISKPEYSWEATVNEGPVALYHENEVFVTFSASPCSGPDYKLGMLTFTGGDPLSADSWVKSPAPVFQRSDANGVFAPGHNGFFKSPDGTEDWIVYHANSSVTGGCDHGRTTRVQKITWNADGTPDFGVPVSTMEVIAAPSGDMGVDPLPEFPPFVQIRSYSRPESYLRNTETYVQVGPGQGVDAQFYVVPGLADPDAISIICINLPGYYLRHSGNTMAFAPNDGSEEFAGDATWWVRPGLADDTWMSFESYNQPGMYMGRQFGITALVAVTDTMPLAALEDATFIEETYQESVSP
jgi:GH43 family beta-xylosidase